jgi:hypothetical protein
LRAADRFPAIESFMNIVLANLAQTLMPPAYSADPETL